MFKNHHFAHLLLTTLLLNQGYEQRTIENKDVLEGESVKLECRPRSSLLTTHTAYNWISVVNESYSVAFNQLVLDSTHYKLDYFPDQGKYDLTITKAQYEKDNGRELTCRVHYDPNSDLVSEVYTINYVITVLIPPGEPRITPATPLAREGIPFELTCSSQGGSPDPVIQWYREGTAISSPTKNGGSRDHPTSNTLTIHPRIDDDGKKYRCTVWNRAIREEQKREATVKLHVHYAPRLTVGPYNPLNVMVDSDAFMTCSAIANPVVRSVKWLNKEGLLLSNTYNHTITAVTPKDSGMYTCVAENGIGDPAKSNLKLSVLFGPRVSLLPEKEITLGESVAVKCNVASNPPPHSLQWLKQGDQYFHQNGDTLRLTSISAEDAGKYTCQASTTLRPSGTIIQKEVTNNATVSIYVRHKPGETEILPRNPIAIAEKPFTLTCSVRPPGWPLPEYRWWKEGHEKSESSHGINYTIISVHVSHEGDYFCQPQNVLGRGSIGSVYLTVHEQPRISLRPRPQNTKKTGDVGFSITCRARGKPKPTVKWFHHRKVILDNSSIYRIETLDNIEDNNAYSVQSTLIFEGPGRKRYELTADDRGLYICEFENNVGEPAQAEMNLRIEHSPIIRHTYNRIAFDVGELAVIQCKIQAYPQPMFEWQYDKRILENYGNYKTNVTDLGDDIYVGTLFIRDLKEDDYGEYTCRVWNQIGGDKKTIVTLVKKGPPERPSELTADASSDRVNLMWLEGFNGGMSNTNFVVTYINTETNEERNESCHSHNPCQILGLQSKTQYRFKVFAVNSRGHSPYSPEIVVMTKVNLKDMPRASDAYYDRTSNKLYFKVEKTEYPLAAKVEARSPGSEEWQLQTLFPLQNYEEEIEINPPVEGFTDIRVVLCLQTNHSWCGDERLVSPLITVEKSKEPKPALSTANIVIIIVIAGCVLIILIISVVCCCWCRKGKNEKKNYEMESGSGHPKTVSAPFYSEGLNKSIENNLDLMSKPNIYMSNIVEGTPGSLNSHMMQQSNNGMLYNSTVRDGNPSLGSDGQSDMWIKSGDYPQDGSYHPYDGNMPNGYFYPEDYQPLTEEVMNIKNREHLRAPYYDVSGLPDPYAMGEEEKTQQMSLSFDESLESGYSTPNSRSRRVIREIIV